MRPFLLFQTFALRLLDVACPANGPVEESDLRPVGPRVDPGVERPTAICGAFEFSDGKRGCQARAAELAFGFESPPRLREREVVEPDMSRCCTACAFLRAIAGRAIQRLRYAA